MDRLFFSKNNFALLHKIINDKIKEQHDYEIENKYNRTIANKMNYVFSNVDPRPPPNVPESKYLDMMNIKCISEAIPFIENQIRNERDLTKPPQFKMQEGNRYAPENMPVPQMSSNREDVNEKLEELKNSRVEPSSKKMSHPKVIEKNAIPPEVMDQEYNKRLAERGLSQQSTKTRQPASQLLNQIEQKPPHPTQQWIPPRTLHPPKTTTKPVPTAAPTREEFMYTHRDLQQVHKKLLEEDEEEQKQLGKGHEKHEFVTLKEKKKMLENNGEIISSDKDIVTMPPNEVQRIEDFPAYHQNDVSNTISPVILPQKPRYVKKVHFLTIDSKDRDLEIYPNPSHFQVKFGPSSDDKITKPICVKYESGNINYVVTEDIVGDHGASITREYENILYIQCLQALIPKNTIYVCGICPNRYYANDIDTEFCDPAADRIPVQDNTYRAIWNNKIGIETTVLDEPYLYLNIKELESYSPYGATNTTGRNAFAKLVYEANFGFLSSYIKMQTADVDEFYTYSPTALSKIDKFTLSLQRPEGDLFDFGHDKLFVLSFERSPILLKHCDNVNATRVSISEKLSFCKCSVKCNCKKPVESHCLRPGDLIYFYSTKPCNPSFIKFQNPIIDICYTNFQLVINNSNDTSLNITIFIIIDENTEEPIDFTKFLCVGDYLVLRVDFGGGNLCNEFFQVLDLNATNITICRSETFELTNDVVIHQIGFAKKNNRGIQTKNVDDLTSQFGVRVCNVGDSILDCATYDPDDSTSGIEGDPLAFDIEFPYDQLERFCVENYKEGEIFFIKQKLQVSYTFKVAVLEKDYNQLESLLVGP